MTAPASQRGRTPTLTGTVVGSPQDKTAIVAVERTVMHPLYRRYVKKTRKFYAHDEANDTRAGDRVLIVASRPMSKLKRWRVREILERAEEI